MGGTEQVIHQIAQGSRAFGVDSTVLSLSSNPSPPSVVVNGYTSHRAKLDFEIASTGFSWSVLSRFKALAGTSDVVHYHYPWPFMDVIHFASRLNKPTVVTYHSDIIRQTRWLRLYRPLQERFLSDVSRIVATSGNYVESSPVLKRYADKLRVIPIGLDRSTYPTPTPDRLNRWRTELGEKFFLFVGVLRYYKGLHILIEAARQTHLPIVIVGAGPIEQSLKQHAHHAGVSNVRFLGHVSDEDKVALLSLSYCVLFPSHLRAEAFGVSLLEGAMFGKPMISSEIGTGTTYVNISGETGLVVPPRDPHALRHAMLQLWHQPALAQSMGAQAARRYATLFTGSKMAQAYAELYRDLVQPE